MPSVIITEVPLGLKVPQSWKFKNEVFQLESSEELFTNHFTGGAISSDLYRPQSQDEVVEFSFFVALSYECKLQLGCLWWKISTSSLKTYFTNLVLTFVNLVSRHENCNFPRFTWWKVDEQRKMHWVAHIFITDYKKPSFSKIGQHLGTPKRF